MTAASYWSLLAPAIEMAESSGSYGESGEWAFIPVAIGFALGAAFVFWADKIVPSLVSHLVSVCMSMAPFKYDDAKCFIYSRASVIQLLLWL